MIGDVERGEGPTARVVPVVSVLALSGSALVSTDGLALASCLVIAGVSGVVLAALLVRRHRLATGDSDRRTAEVLAAFGFLALALYALTVEQAAVLVLAAVVAVVSGAVVLRHLTGAFLRGRRARVGRDRRPGVPRAALNGPGRPTRMARTRP